MLRSQFCVSLCLSLCVSALVASGAVAQPLDLGDPEPRWVQVAFEISPSDHPGSTRTRFTRPLPAWFEPAEAAGRVRLRVSAPVVERHLLAGRRPKPGSFSDFVWALDAVTGHVLSAELSGTLLREVDWGFFSTDVEARIRVRMDTRRRAGFQGPERLFGALFFAYCSRGADCTPVEPRRYDEDSGYVNAVGALSVRSAGMELHAFSPLGEAVFSEWSGGDAPGATPAAATALLELGAR